jgi:sugar phosphate isomerase/epimerase
MSINRRDFLRNSSFAAVGLSMPFLSKANFLDATAGFKIPNFGIQLWTVKENMIEDAKGTLAKLASFGFKQIESYEGPQGMFWGMGHKGFKSYIDDLGMKIVSSHCDNLTDFDKKSEEAAAIGMKYLICPHKGPQKSLDNYKAFADEFNVSGKIAKKHGIKFAYHNHDYSFIPMDGQMPQDVMMQGTDPSLVDFEMDIYWVNFANQDPIAWLKKYPNRFKLCHVKDLTKKVNNKQESCVIGTGIIDFKKVLKAGAKYGLASFFVEQEEFTGTNPIDAAGLGAKYMQKNF